MVRRPPPQRGEPKTRLKIITLYTPFRKQLLALIREHPGVSYRGLAKLTGRCQQRISDNVRHLIEARLVYVVKEPWRNYLYLNGVKHRPVARPPTQVAENVRRVYEYVRAHEEATRQQVMRELGLTRHQAYRAMNELERMGLIRQMRRVTIARLVRDVSPKDVDRKSLKRRK